MSPQAIAADAHRWRPLQRRVAVAAVGVGDSRPARPPYVKNIAAVAKGCQGPSKAAASAEVARKPRLSDLGPQRWHSSPITDPATVRQSGEGPRCYRQPTARSGGSSGRGVAASGAAHCRSDRACILSTQPTAALSLMHRLISWRGTATVSAAAGLPGGTASSRNRARRFTAAAPRAAAPVTNTIKAFSHVCNTYPPPPRTPGSICNMKRNTHTMVPQGSFRLLAGADSLTLYQFETKTAQHLFCK